MQTNSSLVSGSRQQSITPEIAEALKTLRSNDFRLESEFHPFGDWESRLEMAEELRALLDDLEEAQADEVARIAANLEDEATDFSTWDTRTDAAERMRRVVRALETPRQEVAV
jgi:hypothetical protein